MTLSGGEAQRVAVCAAVAHGPDLILADEPTGELDPGSADEVYDLLAAAAPGRGAALLVVSHDNRAARIADRIVRIRDGRLSEEWTPGTPATSRWSSTTAAGSGCPSRCAAGPAWPTGSGRRRWPAASG